MRYAILSDVHGNLPALQAVLDDLAGRAVDALLYLGDAVGYYADSCAVAERLAECVAPRSCSGLAAPQRPWVAGNHEWGAIGRLAPQLFSPAALFALKHIRADMPAATRELLAGLPERLEIELDAGLVATLVHASPADPVGATGAGYVENGEDAREAAQFFSTQICLVGHTHCPLICREAAEQRPGRPRWEAAEIFDDRPPGNRLVFGSERLLFNPGSVGQPRDGDPRAAYAVLDTTARAFELWRVAYDIAETQARLRAWLSDAPAALLDARGGLAERLSRGI